MKYEDVVLKLVDLVGFEVEVYDRLNSAKEVLENKSYDVDIDVDINEINKVLENINVKKIGNYVVKSIQLSKELKNNIGSFQNAKKIMVELAKTIIGAQKELLELFKQLEKINKDDEYKKTIDVIIKFIKNNKFDDLSDKIKDTYIFDSDYWNKRLAELSMFIGYYIDGMKKLFPIYKELTEATYQETIAYMYANKNKSSKIIKWLDEHKDFKSDIIEFFETIKNVPKLSNVLTRRLPKDQIKALNLDDSKNKQMLDIINQPLSPMLLFGRFIQHSPKLYELAKQPTTITNIKQFTEELKKFSEQINRMIDERIINKMEGRIEEEWKLISISPQDFAKVNLQTLKNFQTEYNNFIKFRPTLTTFSKEIKTDIFKVKVSIDYDLTKESIEKIKNNYFQSKENHNLNKMMESIKDKMTDSISRFEELINKKEEISKKESIEELKDYIIKVEELCKKTDELNKLLFDEFKYKDFDKLGTNFKETKSFMIWFSNTIKLKKMPLSVLKEVIKYSKDKEIEELHNKLEEQLKKKKSSYNELKPYKEAISNYKEKFFEKKFKKVKKIYDNKNIKGTIGGIMGILIDYQTYIKQMKTFFKKIKDALKKEE